MKKTTAIFILCLLSLAVMAQTGNMKFDKMSHDFGSVKEEAGSVTTDFNFTNTGSVPLIISNVKASCGCTTPDWTKDPVLPGKTGFIRAVYSTTNRPGPFNKSLTITANTEPSTTTLFISGTVVPKPKTPEEEYTKKVGNLRMVSDILDFGRITTKDTISKTFVLYNDGNNPITFIAPQGLPKHLHLKITPMILGSKQKAMLKITYDPKKKNDFGAVSDQITIMTNEPADNKKALSVKADINEYFPPLSEQALANAPKLELATEPLNLGIVKPKGTATGYIEFTNTGKQDLVIRKVRTSGPALVAHAEKSTIKAGMKGKIKVTYTAGDKPTLEGFIIW
ncbi:MAG: DUF1573 domain-containing protein, partial [Cytophagaceae bacterium]